MKLSFKEGRDNTMSMVVEVGGGGGVKGLFRRATSQRERRRYFDAARVKAPV
jgi:hypothetical protein